MLGELEVLLMESLTAERHESRKHAEQLLGEIADRGGAAGPDRATWGLLPHQVEAAERAQRMIGGEG